jgi:hypothetical protein
VARRTRFYNLAPLFSTASAGIFTVRVIECPKGQTQPA